MEAFAPFLCKFCGAYLHSFDRLQRHRYRHKMIYIASSKTAPISPYFWDLCSGGRRHRSNHLNIPVQFRSGLVVVTHHTTYFGLVLHNEEEASGPNPKYQCQYCTKTNKNKNKNKKKNPSQVQIRSGLIPKRNHHSVNIARNVGGVNQSK